MGQTNYKPSYQGLGEMRSQIKVPPSKLQFHWPLQSSIRSHSSVRPCQPTPDSKQVSIGKTKHVNPRLELIAVHMASNLAENIKSVLTNYNIRDIYGWTNGKVVLHWLRR